MSILSTFQQAPFQCGAEDPERWARSGELIYEDERKNPAGPFAQNAKDVAMPRNRFRQVFAWAESCADRKMASHFLDRVELLYIKHREIEHWDTDRARQDRAEFLQDAIEQVAHLYPKAEALLPLEFILKGFWT